MDIVTKLALALATMGALRPDVLLLLRSMLSHVNMADVAPATLLDLH